MCSSYGKLMVYVDLIENNKFEIVRTDLVKVRI